MHTYAIECVLKVKPNWTLINQGFKFDSDAWTASFSKYGSANRLKIDHETEISICGLCAAWIPNIKSAIYQNRAEKEEAWSDI